jgi:hypothetical protein
MNPKFIPNAIRGPPPIPGALPVFDRFRGQDFSSGGERNDDKNGVYGSASHGSAL